MPKPNRHTYQVSREIRAPDHTRGGNHKSDGKARGIDDLVRRTARQDIAGDADDQLSARDGGRRTVLPGPTSFRQRNAGPGWPGADRCYTLESRGRQPRLSSKEEKRIRPSEHYSSRVGRRPLVRYPMESLRNPYGIPDSASYPSCRPPGSSQEEQPLTGRPICAHAPAQALCGYNPPRFPWEEACSSIGAWP